MTRVAIIAGALPLTDPGVYEELPMMDRVYTRMSQKVPWLARQCFGAMRFAAQRTPDWYGRIAARELGSADGRVIREEGFATFAEMSGEALRHPRGVVRSTGRGSGRGVSPPKTWPSPLTSGPEPTTSS